MKHVITVTAVGNKGVRVETDEDGRTVLSILGPKDGVQARVWLDERAASQVATGIMHSYQGR